MTDFDSYPNQIILEGKDSVAKYVSGNTLIHTITNKINEYASDIYFFSNSLVGESVYIAIAVESLEQAYAYVHNWKTKRIITEEGGKRVDTDILLYKDNDKISFYRETGSENKIIGYLLEDSPAYTVLLRFY